MRRPVLSFPASAVRLAALALLVCALALPPSPASARQPSLSGCEPEATVTNAADSGPGSLRFAVSAVCEGGAINFAGDLTIPLQSKIQLFKPLTIDGSGRTVVLSGTLAAATTGSGGIIENVSPAPVTLRHLTLTAGGANHGGAIYNWTHLYLDDLTITASTVGGSGARGGAIYNNGALTMTNSLLSGNSGARGGAIYNNNAADQLTVSASTFLTNTSSMMGGAINMNNGLVSISASSFSGNSAVIGGAILASSGQLSIGNSTFAANRASTSGAIDVASSSVVTSISNSTFSGNQSPSSGTLNNVGALTLRNTIIANSQGADCLNIGTFESNLNNLIEDGTCGAALAGDPLLGPLGDYNGPTRSFALLPGSPAHGAGDSATCAAEPVNGLDQRGRPRPADCDIGAFESQGFALSVTGGDGQSTFIGTAFDEPLAVALSANDPIEPLGSGTPITFSGPASGASITPTMAIVAADEQGAASLQATANAIAGSYAVTATTRGVAQPVSFALRQFGCAASIQVTSDADSGAGTLRQAVAEACPGATITFAGDYTIRLEGRILLDSTLTIDGTGRAVTISGDSDGDGSPNSQLFALPATGAVTMTHLRLERGFSSDGGVVHITGGRLTLRASTLANNRAGASGGAIMQEGGALLIADTAFISNTAGINGGALHLEDTAAVIANSTFAGSAAANGGAIQTLGGNTTLVNATISGSSSANAAVRAGGTFALRNTIIAASAAGADCSGVTSSAASLVEDGTCAPAFSGDPLLAPLDGYGGATPTFALLPGSPAIGRGDGGACAASPVGGLDQRGVARPAACDLGAFESRGFTLALVGGDQQTAAANRPFAAPLAVAVSAVAAGEPVGPGGVISFNAPSSGASLAQPAASAATDAAGAATLQATANSISGSYAVMASARGAAAPVSFNLTNIGKLFAPLIMRALAD